MLIKELNRKSESENSDNWSVYIYKNSDLCYVDITNEPIKDGLDKLQCEIIASNINHEEALNFKSILLSKLSLSDGKFE